tara:strand:- start:13 stop:345 length:333 start_codon:yes stop_codon:yes gene_type:complete
MSWEDILKVDNEHRKLDRMLRDLKPNFDKRFGEEDKEEPGRTTYEYALQAHNDETWLPEQSEDYFRKLARKFGRRSPEYKSIMQIVNYYKNVDLDDIDYAAINERLHDVQ